MPRRPLLPVVLLALALLATGCDRLVPGRDARQAQWAVDPSWERDPGATEIPLLVVEVECASGRDAAGRVTLDVAESEDEVVVTARVTPRPGGQDCQGNPPTPVVLTLAEPLGDRTLVNGATDEIARRPLDLPDDGTNIGDAPGDPDNTGPGGTVVPGDGMGEAELFLAEAFHARARDASELGDVADLAPHPDGVQLWLGPNLVRTSTAEQLGEPEGWQMDVAEYEGFAGPFSALATAGPADRVTARIGAQPHCAGPPRESPQRLADLFRLAIEPVLGEQSSCIEWFVVNLYVDPDGRLVAVQLDLFGP